MSQELLRMRRSKAGLVATASHLLDTAEQEQRALTDDERATYDDLREQIDQLNGDIERRASLELDRAQLDGVDLSDDSQPDDAQIGMGAMDLRNWSMLRAINAMDKAQRGQRDAWAGAELELEASQAVAKRMGVEPQGFYVPADVVQAELRDLTVGTATAGGHTVATELLASSFIDVLRNRLALNAAGITILANLAGDIAIPRQTGAATAYWVGEGNAPTESQQAVDQVTLTPHTVGAYTDYSRKLLKQSSIDVENFVRTDLASVLALAIDYAGLHGDDGTDANQPDGLAQLSGIGSVVGGTNGLAPAWSHIVDLETAVAVDNADVGRLAYVTNAKVRGKLKQTEKASSTGSWVWADGNTPLNGYNAVVSNQVDSDLDKGTSTGVCSAIFFGNWQDMILGMWGGLDIMVDPYSNSTTGTTRIVALQDVDFGFRHAESFAAMLDALTA